MHMRVDMLFTCMCYQRLMLPSGNSSAVGPRLRPEGCASGHSCCSCSFECAIELLQ